MWCHSIEKTTKCMVRSSTEITLLFLSSVYIINNKVSHHQSHHQSQHQSQQHVELS